MCQLFAQGNWYLVLLTGAKKSPIWGAWLASLDTYGISEFLWDVNKIYNF